MEENWKIYHDDSIKDSKTLMGFKGNTILDAGYFYAPYVPMTQTLPSIDPNTWVPSKGILTRYGKKIMDNNPYAPTISEEKIKKKMRTIFDEWEPTKEQCEL